MSKLKQISDQLSQKKERWLVTGAAGFIGSHLVEFLLKAGQEVIGLDNFATGSKANLDDVRKIVGAEAAARFKFIEGDIKDAEAAKAACQGVSYVLHQAALGSVPRSVEDPLSSDLANVYGFLSIAMAAKEARVRRFVYASSSSVYGDNDDGVKTEARTGTPLSPYAVTKKTNELYAGTFYPLYGLENVGLRYFNVFGPRQDPNGAYAAVIPRWIATLMREEPCIIYGDGLTSRDFCFVNNVVEANVLAAITPNLKCEQFNIACGDSTSLLQLHTAIRDAVAQYKPEVAGFEPKMEPFRQGDIKHSLADITHAQEKLGYTGSWRLSAGMGVTVGWYLG